MFDIQTDQSIPARRPDLLIIGTHTYTHTHKENLLKILPSMRKYRVYIRLPTEPKCGTMPFYISDRSRIETHA